MDMVVLVAASNYNYNHVYILHKKNGGDSWNK